METVQADLKRRALAAHYRAGASASQPVQGHVTEVEGKTYVVLRSAENRLLKVYRVQNDGQLKGLRRWPKAFCDDSS